MFSGPLAELVSQLERLPNVGPKSATRLAFHLLRMPSDSVRRLAESMVAARESLRLCQVCMNFSEADTCAVCLDPKRDERLICVVSDPRDVAAIERIREYRGRYHVLHGQLSPLDGVGPDALKLRELVERLRGPVEEVIVATNPTVEGEATAHYIANLLKDLGVRVSRLAHGMPAGGELEYADSATLASALEYRRTM